MEQQPTEQHSVPERFEKSNELFFEIFATSPASNAILDLEEERFIAVNDGFLRLLGYNRGEVIGRTIGELQIEPDVRRQGTLYDQLRQEQRVLWREGHVRTKGGELRSVLGSYTLVKAERATYAVYKLVDVTPIRRLEKEVLEASDEVQRRIGQDLHDGLGGSFTQLILRSELLAAKLMKKEEHEAAADATRIAELLREAVARSRNLVHGLFPDGLLGDGLTAALGKLATHTRETTGTVACTFESEGEVVIEDPNAILHLYRMAQEAVNNALKHGEASRITVRLRCNDDVVALEVEDDGVGLPEELIDEGIAASSGAGLRSIRYRARLIGATVQFTRRAEGGSLVRCALPRYVSEAHCAAEAA